MVLVPQTQSTILVLLSQQVNDLAVIEQSLVVWTIRISLLMMFVSLLLRILQKPTSAELGGVDQKKIEQSLAAELGQHSWLLGSLFSLLHLIVTMLMVHGGSHTVAMAHTADQSEAMIGIRAGWGLYFNYAFVIIWLIDALWWIGLPTSFRRRSVWLNGAVIGFLIFVAFNGAVVFAQGPIRWISLAMFAVLAILFLVSTRRSTDHEPSENLT
ncbi:MAG: hypothetical protein AAFN77_05250 [Planctomycetota bacterium]